MTIKFYPWEPSDGDLTEERMAEKMRSLGFHPTKYVYPPGTVFPSHSHPIDKIDGVLEGTLEIEIEGKTYQLKPGDMLFISKFTVHSARVVGENPVVSLDAQKYKE